MTATLLAPGSAVEAMAGEAEVWPTLAVATIGTTVTDGEGRDWTRHRVWWAGPDGARLTSQQLGLRGPLTVRSVHVCEDWIDETSMCSPNVTSTCVTCGSTKETPR